MTYVESIKWLKETKRYESKCANCNYMDECGACNAECFDIADMAIASLEKQIPHKPDYEGDGYADGKLVYNTWICPCCGERYEVDYDNYAYCPKCGQCIDHSDESDSEE